ncbi:hypothetical protein HAX54_027645 [Datura stramonium]|uniref:Uncharacterized protein n=1 Tax=Datura stramonium TaxID=4076 RepID=A0ABS8V3Q9_DATST|nr:hypothetical protein [Datura stramonium]
MQEESQEKPGPSMSSQSTLSKEVEPFHVILGSSPVDSIPTTNISDLASTTPNNPLSTQGEPHHTINPTFRDSWSSSKKEAKKTTNVGTNDGSTIIKNAMVGEGNVELEKDVESLELEMGDVNA